MKKLIVTMLILLGIALIVMGLILLVFPEWLEIPGGWLILLGAVFVGVAGLGENLKAWNDLLFHKGIDAGKQNRRANDVLRQRLSISKNLLIGKNKIQSNHNNADINNNALLGENEIVASEETKDSTR